MNEAESRKKEMVGALWVMWGAGKTRESSGFVAGGTRLVEGIKRFQKAYNGSSGVDGALKDFKDRADKIRGRLYDRFYREGKYENK